MKKTIFLSILVSCFSGGFLTADAGSAVRYDYKQNKGSTAGDVHLYLEKTDCCWRLTCDSPDEKSVSLNNDSFYTLEWSMTSQDDDSDIRVVRENNTLLITGKHKRRSVEKRVVIDEAPWHQATSLSLRGFASSDEQERVFWFLRSDCLWAVKFNALKEGVEQIRIGDRTYSAYRITIRPTGIKSLLWKGIYWFSVDEGILLRFLGSAGLPGVGASETIFVGCENTTDPLH